MKERIDVKELKKELMLSTSRLYESLDDPDGLF